MERESTSSRSSSEGERKQVTVLFADVAGFTPLSEELDPEETHDLLRPAIDIMASEVHTYEGTVAQFMGDGLMALFGAPLAHEDDPQRAIYAALAMQRRLQDYKEGLKSKGMELSIRIGINTGLVMVGSIGDDLAMEYTAIGDTVNLASRMESSAEPGTVQVSESTYRLTQGYFNYSDLGEISVKGKGHPVHAYQVLAPRGARTRMEAAIPAGLSPLVGRAQELAYLADHFRMAAEGEGQVIGIVGEPGVGKSRLVLEFRYSLPPEDYTYLEGSCLHYGESIPYLPLLDILRGFFDLQETDEESVIKSKLKGKLAGLDAQLQAGLPPLQELLSLKVEDEGYLSLDPQVRRQLAFESIRNLLVRLSLDAPLVIAIEDLQWMDHTTGEFLGFLIDSIPVSHILLILLYRPEYTSPWTSRSFWTQLSLRQLPEDNSSSLVAAILPGAQVSSEVSDLIIAKTAGNPLFIEELTRGLMENGTIKRDNGSYVMAGSALSLEIPETVQGIIAARLDRLEEDSKRTIQVASVIGRDFAYRLLAAVTSMQEQLKGLLAELQSLELIYEKSLFPELEYIFKHALTQEVAYESLLLKHRRELHGKIGQAIEDIYPERLEEFFETLAYHYSRSDDADKAIQYLKLSGDKSTRNYANWEAIRFYKEAIKILDGQPESEEIKRNKLEMCLAIQHPLVMLSHPEGSLEILQEAERLAEELEDNARLIAVYTICALYYTFKGDISLGLEYSEKVIDAAEEIKDVESMSVASNRVCLVMFQAGDYLETASIGRRALELIEEQHREKDIFAGGWSIYVSLCGYFGLALGVLGLFEEAGEVLDKGLKVSREMEDTLGIAWIEIMQAAFSSLSGDMDLIEQAREASELSEETGAELMLGFAWSFLGLGHYFLGDFERAKDYTERGLERQRKTGLPVIVPLTYYFSSLVLFASGDLEGAEAHAREGVRLSREFGTKAYEGLGWIALGRAVGEADPSGVEAAQGYIREGISLAEKMKAKPFSAEGYLFLGEVFEIADRGEEALENLRKAEEMYLEMGVAPDSYWLARAREALARLESVS